MSIWRRTAPTSNHGFTLIELMLVMTLLAGFMVVVYQTVIVGLRSADAANERENVRMQLTRALDLLTREASVAYNVDRSDADRFQFDARLVDANSDGSAENRTNINYRISSGDFQRVQGGDTVTLVPDCTSATPFTYLDASNVATTTEANVRVMQISLSATRDGETITLATSVRPRNL